VERDVCGVEVVVMVDEDVLKAFGRDFISSLIAMVVVAENNGDDDGDDDDDDGDEDEEEVCFVQLNCMVVPLDVVVFPATLLFILLGPFMITPFPLFACPSLSPPLSRPNSVIIES